MQKISWAEPAREPRQKLATLAFILEISQYLYSRSTSGAGNLQLGTKILIVPHIGNFKLQLKNGGTFSCYFSPHHACPIGWPHVHQVKFRVAQLDTMYLTILGISSDSFVSADSSMIDDEHYLLFQRIKYLV